ncbi:MAG: SCO6880 family protein [Propionibacteriaceae bacterium]
MTAAYDDYGPDRVGFFFGLTGPRLAALTLAVIPVFVAVNQQRWALAGEWAAVAAVVTVLVVVPVRGRSATGWLLASLSFAVGKAFGWASWRSKAATGKAEALEDADLPGVMTGIEVHDGTPKGPAQTRFAVIQDHGLRTWAMTATLRHPGVGMAQGELRDHYGRGLAELLDIAARAALISDVVFLVRTVPDDGAERQQWIATHRRPDGPELARRMNDELATALSRAAVRTESFVTFVVPETRIGKQAREFGGGLEGRTRVLYALADEVSAMLRGGMGMTGVEWLTSPQLALAVRTGFAPADRAGIIDALAAHLADPSVCAEVPWAMAGPSGADTAMRHYSHDAWNSISSTIKLPDRGACLGALAPVLTPSEPGERRSYTVVFPILPFSRADRQTASDEWAADMGEGLRGRLQIRQRTRDHANVSRAHRLDAKLASGHALTRPYAVACVTVAKTMRIAEFGRRLDASIRRAGFAPLRLDLAQDTGFAAATLPLGLGLTRKADE